MAKKQKKQYAPWVIAVVVVCLLIELVGVIPGIPFNGWTDVLNWFGMPQTAIAPEGELTVWYAANRHRSRGRIDRAFHRFGKCRLHSRASGRA